MNSFPDNKKFAFTIFDDTDLSTVDNLQPMYRLLADLGMRTTKSVWPLASVPEGKYSGSSLQDAEYREFILQLRDLGFEIALHNVRNHHACREMVVRGLEEFRKIVGQYPAVHANHSRNAENLYWGAARFHSLKPLYALGSALTGARTFRGHLPGGECFWGDLCREHIKYVRNFVFREINLDRVNPTMPYHEPGKPFVNYWFSSCDGADVERFCELLSEENQEKLEREGGVCIVYTHFACGFVENGRVNSRVEELLRALAARGGWFVPVSNLLDHLRSQRSNRISRSEILAMESRWARDRVKSAARYAVRALKQSLAANGHPTVPATHGASKTRIVHVTSAHSPLDTRIFYKECRSLAGAGYDVTLLGAHSMNEVMDGVQFRGLGKSQGRRHRMTTKLTALCGEALRLNADVYHIHDPELLFMALLLRATGKRVIYDIHEDLPRTILYKRYIPDYLRKPLMWAVERFENLSARIMTGLVTATPTIDKRFSAIHRHTAVVNNFPLRDELAPTSDLAWGEREMSVAYIGGISEERGIREMLTAVDLLPESLGARLELAGKFSPPDLQTEMAARAEWKHVNWHGMLDRDDICALLGRVRAGLVVLHPEQNFVVSQPIKLFEYMAAGIPVIASDFPLWRSIIEKAGCGMLVDPFRPEQTAGAIERLLSDSALAEEMGRCGRRAVEERFNWNAEESTLLSFYSSIVANGRVAEAQPIALETSAGAR
jgi:glycosyltransferase involved in cell wall biosynthesis